MRRSSRWENEEHKAPLFFDAPGVPEAILLEAPGLHLESFTVH